MTRRLFIPLLFIFILFQACANQPGKIISRFNLRAKQIGQETIPDKALAVFRYRLVKEDKWVLEGESTSRDATERVHNTADSLLGKGNYEDHFRILPDPALGDSSYAVVIVSVTPLRRGPRHASEMLDQVIMGNALQLLEKNKGWYLVKNHYGYVGWINKTAIQRMDKKSLDSWLNSDRMQVSALLSFVYQRPSLKALHFSDLVLNATVKKIGQKGKWIQAELADGTTGFVPANDLGPLITDVAPADVPAKMIIRSAKSMLGIPYLWGGKSSKASDCSGFTQTVFRANGIQLPRDARQQALIGKTIIPKTDFSNVHPGDLLFFGVGERITHVGISLGGYNFIHQDSDVHINSFDSHASNFNAFRKKSLKLIKRILK